MAMTRWQRKEKLDEKLGHGAVGEIASRAKKSLTHTSQVINGHRRDRDVEVAVARAIGRPVDEVFEPIQASDNVAEPLEPSTGSR